MGDVSPGGGGRALGPPMVRAARKVLEKCQKRT